VAGQGLLQRTRPGRASPLDFRQASSAIGTFDFGERLHEPEKREEECPTRCPQCGQHFSVGDRFCPFDGEPLVRALDWDPSGDPLIDSVVDGRYRIEAVIGQGGMGTVYRVRHVLLDKLLALKALRADLASDPEIADRFIHEARTAASVSHPDLVQISDFGTLPSGQAYFVMDLLQGVPLSALLRRYGALSPRRAVRLIHKTAAAVQAAHDAGIVHRDLKPDNVHVRVLEGDDEIKIVDFGLARVVGSHRRTRAGVVFGTPYYMSPEQASGENIGPQSDVYSLGIVFYELLTGRVPFEADTYMGVLTQHIYMKPLPLGERLGKVLDVGALEAIVLRCLEKQPGRRFGSMNELIAALDALDIESLPLEPLGSAEPPERLDIDLDEVDSSRLVLAEPSPWRPYLLAGAFLAALLGAVLSRGFFMTADDVPPKSTAQTPTVAPSPQDPPPAAPPPLLPGPAPAAPDATAPAPAPRASSGKGPRRAPLPGNTARSASVATPGKSAAQPRKSVAAEQTPLGHEIVDPWGSRP
jgi:serine/threonine protein kinase